MQYALECTNIPLRVELLNILFIIALLVDKFDNTESVDMTTILGKFPFFSSKKLGFLKKSYSSTC